MAPFRTRFALLAIPLSYGLLTVPAGVRADTMTVSNSLNATIQANGSLSVPGSATLTNSGTVFNAFSGAVTVQYRARSTAAGGGTLTLRVTQDFQTGGPSVSGGDLTYTCGAAGLGTACGSTTASTSSATTVVTLPASACTGGGSPCSATDPNTVLVTFTLADRPVVKTGTFTANVQFTISAT
jgi:hypothetical protein